LGKKVSDRRGKKVTSEKQKNDDFYRIRIVMYLFANKEGNRNQMMHNNDFGINRIERGRLSNLLEKMIEDGWMQKIETSGMYYPIYKLDTKGLEVASFIQKLKSEEPSNFHFEFESFAGIKRL